MKKNIFILLIICLIGLVLRLLFVDKSEGLWNDEYVSWMIASTPFGSGFWNAVKSQCHMPLYYLYLKFFMFLFGQSDLLLRLTSVIAGVISIPVMYLVGKELNKNEKCGLMCAGMTSISSFLIYYSQEVRLYSLLFLISALCLFYTIKLLKNPIKLNLIMCMIFNSLIIFTHTIGFVFVFFNLIFISLNLYKKFEKFVKVLWSLVFLGTCLLIPLITKILTGQTFSQWWDKFTISKIGFLFTDYFSPVLTNLTGAPSNFFYMPKILPFMLITSILAIVCIFKSLKNNKLKAGLFCVAFGYAAVLVVAATMGKLVFVTKYSIEIYPILIFLACSCEFKNKYLMNIIISFYCLISIGYLFIGPTSIYKIYRAEGHKIVADMIDDLELQQGDWLLFEYYPPDRFSKYLNLTKYNTLSINKGNFYEYMSGNLTYSDVYKNGKTLYKDLFLSDTNTCLGNKLKNEIFDKLQTGQSVVMIVLNSVAFYTPDDVKKIAQDNSLYKQTPLLFLVFSYIKKETYYELEKVLVPQKVGRKGKWLLVKFTKVNN